MAKIEIERGQATVTASVVARIGIGDLRKRLGIPDGASVSIVGTGIVEGLADGDVLVAEWTETKVARARGKKGRAKS